MVVLAVLALIGIFGPALWPHPYDRVYPQFVRVPASLEAYPRAETILPGFERELQRTRLEHDAPVLDGSEISVAVRSDEEIDPRVLRYFERSDLFSNPRLELSEDKTSGTITVHVQRLHFFFGTDAIGRDLAARIMIGVRISLAIGILASAMALLLGVSYGAISGYLGGRVDNVMMRIVDILYSLPFIFFVILMVVFFGRSLVIIFIAIGFTEWLDMARIVRGQTLSLKRQEFVQAAEALGATKAGILTRHIIPNTLGPVVVFVTLLVPKAILLESLLSFLGLGRAGPADLARPPDLGGRGQHARRALAPDLAGADADADPLRAQLPRRRAARLARSEGPLSDANRAGAVGAGAEGRVRDQRRHGRWRSRGSTST